MLEQINTAFHQLIRQRGIYRKIAGEGCSPYERQLLAGRIRKYRWMLHNDQPISIEKKLLLLQRGGIRLTQKEFSRQDMVHFARFVQCQGKVSQKDLGYCLEKFLQQQKKGR